MTKTYCEVERSIAPHREAVTKYRDSLRDFLARKIGNDAEDVVQELMLAQVAGTAPFRNESTLRTYLFQAARYRLSAHYRRSSARKSVRLDDAPVLAVSTSPEETIDRKREQALVLRAIQSLPVPLQRVVELAVWDERSVNEIAALLAIPPGTVRSRTRLALKRLRAQMIRLQQKTERGVIGAGRWRYYGTRSPKRRRLESPTLVAIADV